MKINQAFKNIKRLQRIGTVLVAHGFGPFLDESGLLRFIPFVGSKPGGQTASIPVGLRRSFEELGTTFVKLGQMLSIRPDLIPQEFIVEFRKLQDQLPPVDVNEIRAQVEKELDLPLEEAYDDFQPLPIGAASIAQVHRARLKDGTEVVVKVRRAGIREEVETDLSILFAVADILDRYWGERAPINPRAIVNEFASVVRRELDFIREAQNIERFFQNFEEDENVVIPTVFWPLTGRRVLTMSYLCGTPLREVEELRKQGRDLKRLARVGVETFFKMVFRHGFFHGDIHGGNVLVLDEGVIGIIDFGVVGRLDGRLLEDVASLFLSLVTRDFRALARQYLRIAADGGNADPEELARELQSVIEPLLGLSLAKIDAGAVLMDLAGVAQRHRLQVPQDLLLLFRAITTLDAIGRELDPDFDVIEAASEFAGSIMVDRYKPERLLVDLVGAIRDLADLGRDMPGQLSGIMRQAERGKLGVGVHVHDRRTLSALKREGWRVSTAILAVGGALTLGLSQVSGSFGFAGFLGLLLLLGGGAGIVISNLLWNKER